MNKDTGILDRKVTKMRSMATALHRQYLSALHQCRTDAQRDEVADILRNLHNMTMTVGQTYYDVDVFSIKEVQ